MGNSYIVVLELQKERRDVREVEQGDKKIDADRKTVWEFKYEVKRS